MSNTRISSMAFQQSAAAQMSTLEAAIAKTQSQLSSTSRLQNASDDPEAMSQVNQLNQQLSASQQYVTNSKAANSNLTFQTQAMTDATSILTSARDLSVEANDASLNDSELGDIASQLQQLLEQLVSTANGTDSNGNYLFSGTASSTKPFSQSGNTITYSGSDSVSQVQISSNQRISGGDTGASVFMDIGTGNGTFATTAGDTNTGTTWIDAGSVTDASQWSANAGTYTISFTDASNYQVTDVGGNVVSSGTFESPQVIAFDGIQTTITGAPAAGDSYTITPSGSASAFSSLSSLISALKSNSLTAAQRTSVIASVQAQLDQSITHINTVQASAGARINAITASQTTATAQQTALQTNISSLKDVDYAEATTRLASQELALQAAQQSYASLQNMSLFNYLK